MEKQFTWLIASQLDGNRNLLEKGKVHNTSDFPIAWVELWVKEKAAKWIGEKSEKKEKKSEKKEKK